MSTQQEAPEAADPKGPAGASGTHRRHRTGRHVAWHAGGATGVSGAAAIAHVAGATGLGIAAGAGALAVGGLYAIRRSAKDRGNGAGRGRVLPRVRTRPSRDASGRPQVAGLRRGAAATSRRTTAAGATSRRKPGATGAPGSRRSAGLRRGQSPSRTSAKGGRRTATTVRRARPASTAPSATARGRGAAAPSRPAKGRGKGPSSARPGSTRRASGGAAPASTRRARAAATRTRARKAAKIRPIPRRAAPAMRTQTKPGATRRSATSRHSRHAARIARRHGLRALRFVKARAKASRPYLRLRPPAQDAAAQAAKKTASAKAAAKKSPAKKAAPKSPAATATAKPGAKKTAAKKPGAPVRRPASKRPTARAGRAIAAPGNEREKMSDLNIPGPGTTAVADAIDEHIGGWEPQNATDIFQFLAGLEPMCSHLGMALGNAADRLGSDYPLDQAVVGHLQEMAALAVNLGAWGESAHSLARAAHENDLQRLENPRPNEQVFDIQANQ